MTWFDRLALALAAAGLLSMPIFAVIARRRPRDAEVASRPTTVLLGAWVREWLMWAISPVVGACVRWRISPLVFNLAGVLFGAAAGVAYARGAFTAGGWLVLLGGLADVFDGRIARARNLVSDAGAFIDSTLDRFAESFAFAGLAMRFADSPWAELVVSLALGGSLLVSYTRARGEGLGVRFRGGLMQRAERLVSLAVASLLDPVVCAAAGWPSGRLVLVAIGAIAAGSLGTACYRTWTIARALDERAR